MTPTPQITIDAQTGQAQLIGAAVMGHVAELERVVTAHTRDTDDHSLDISKLSAIDTSGAYVLAQYSGTLTGADSQTANLIAKMREVDLSPIQSTPPAKHTLRQTLINISHKTGTAVSAAGAECADLLRILGQFIGGLGSILRQPRRLHITALTTHAQETGLRAVPIVALMAFLIGVVLAFQGSAQLRQFGAEIFVVDLIAVSVTRELGILLTAIIVAGRTASAFTAAIGSMKMREEIDAMKVLGLDVTQALIVPRVLGLMLMLPILGLIANLCGLLGGALMSWSQLGISPTLFLNRLVENTSVDHVIVGMVKAPVFALVIGIVGCQAGLRVRGTAESLGMMTSRAVVTAIFAVIMIDAAFSIFFAQMGM